MSTQPELERFDTPVLLVEARYRERPLSAQVLHARSPRGFTVGRARRADAPVDPRFLPPELPANDNHTLVEARDGGFIVRLPPAMRERAERSATGLRIPCGEVVFDISAAAAPPEVPRSWLRRGWRDDARVTGGVALAMLLLLLLVRAVPSDPHALSLDDVGRAIRMGTFQIMPPVVPEPPPMKGARGPSAGGGAPRAASGPSGAAGDRTARPREARRATKGNAQHQDARAVEAYVRTSSLLTILDGAHSGPLAQIFDKSAALGDHAEEVLSHLEGREIASAYGKGLGPSGTGAGAAGTGEAMRGGARGLGTIGRFGDKDGPGRGYGSKAGSLTSKPHHQITIDTSGVILRGSLDKELVRRVVRQHLNEVRFCYEEALARKPTLAGRVVPMFTIAANGTVIVSALQSSTLGAPAVEACIVGATRRWLFPQPRGGGIVTVSYPFQLSPAGG
jgi:hypothetical protein